MLNRELADPLGFTREMFEPSQSHIASSVYPSGDLRASCRGQYVGEPPQRSPLHTAEIHPLENERCGGGRTETFPVLQYKRLVSGPLSQLTLTILDTGGRNLDFDYLSAVLHIRRNG